MKQEFTAALEACDKVADSTLFIEFSLSLILEAIEEFTELFQFKKQSSKDRVSKANDYFDSRLFSRKDYLIFQKSISTSTASRDLKDALKSGLLSSQGEKAMTRCRFQ